MDKKYLKYFIVLASTLLFDYAYSQKKDTTVVNCNNILTNHQVNILLYARCIVDAEENKRLDENIVGNLKLLSWLNVEGGFRQGERSVIGNSYYHYKIEAQITPFKKAIKVITRLSDNVISYPLPYRKTNYLSAVEGKYSIFKKTSINGGLGYVRSFTKNNSLDALPTSKGIKNNSVIFKIAIHYSIQGENSLEIAYGTYDVFNPYALNQPFTQVVVDKELTKRCFLYSYYRYQFNKTIFAPYNHFFCIGFRITP